MSSVSRIGSVGALALTAALLPLTGSAKPIAFAHGTTVMAEYGAGTMEELQIFHAPKFSYSVGGGYLALESAIDGQSTEITYARVNYLAKRWNHEASQANVFVWGGIGSASTDKVSGNQFAWNAGFQVDYETRRVYASLKSDLHESSGFSHRIDTLQLGFAPYEHDYDDVATWFVVQGRRYTGEVFDGTEWALLLRLFKSNKWIDVGATADGKLQAMFMFNF